MNFFGGAMPLDYDPPPVSKKPRKWPAITPEMHEQIKRLYQTSSQCDGSVREFVDRYRLPRWKITRYAIDNAWTHKQPKEPNWSDDEIKILERNAHRCPNVIQRKLRAAGFSRSAVGIVLKRKKLRLPSNLSGYSSRQLAKCLGEDDHFVQRHIKLGNLRASRRGTLRTERQGGDIYYIKESQIRAFIIENINLIDLRKVDKHWFFDILTSRGGRHE